MHLSKLLELPRENEKRRITVSSCHRRQFRKDWLISVEYSRLISCSLAEFFYRYSFLIVAPPLFSVFSTFRRRKEARNKRAAAAARKIVSLIYCWLATALCLITIKASRKKTTRFKWRCRRQRRRQRQERQQQQQYFTSWLWREKRTGWCDDVDGD